MQDKFRAVLSAIDNGVARLENLDLWFSDSDTAILSVLYGCAHIVINTADEKTPIWLWQDGTCKCFTSIVDFERRMKQELDDGLVVPKGLACNRNHFNALVLPDFDSAYPDDNDFDRSEHDDNECVMNNDLGALDENECVMNDDSDLDARDGDNECAEELASDCALDRCNLEMDACDEKHVEWMEGSFEHQMRLASPGGSGDNECAAPSSMTPINTPMEPVNDSIYDTPVNGKHPKKLGESAVERKKRIRILKKQALDPEQLEEQKRKNLGCTHKHRDKRKKMQCPHLNNKQPTPKPTLGRQSCTFLNMWL